MLSFTPAGVSVAKFSFCSVIAEEEAVIYAHHS